MYKNDIDVRNQADQAGKTPADRVRGCAGSSGHIESVLFRVICGYRVPCGATATTWDQI